ncbi:nidogen-1-like isoform X3 [Liolophura sinensis]|uniref:nidogen-1-like isoform X3 n=1 Tax=Liolophura sinensis TaxID=3198878 RepID=UPI0031590879
MVPFRILVSAALLCCVNSVPLSLFYEFGPESGDSALPAGDDLSSSEIQLLTPVAFFDQIHPSIFVNLNGHLSFETELPVYQANLVLPSGYQIIAAFLADIDTRATGSVYYRETSDSSLIQRAAADIRSHFAAFSDFQPRTLFIATWEKVGYFKQNSDRQNTFQIVVASDGRDSFVFFHYLDDGVQWLQSDGKLIPVLNDPPAQAGFDSGKGRKHLKLRVSGTNQALDLPNLSNINVPGVWMFQIGSVKEGNVLPADINTGEVFIFELDGDDATCLEGARTCHPSARCVDFSPGFCCECVQPFYGNGRSCLEPGVPQRLNGKVSVNLNGEDFVDLDQHSYVVTTDGRSYTAISRLPSSIGHAMQTLNTLGGIVGWLFAVPISPRARNGYMFTGGEFNRTTVVRYQSGEEVTIRQMFYGHDALNNMRMDTFITGSLPSIPVDKAITVDDFKEEYRRVSPGLVKSSSSRTYRVDDVAFRYSWEQEITYKECTYDSTRAYRDTLRLSVSRNFVVYDPRERIVRYAMTSRISVLTGNDPCADADQKCGPNSDCIPQGDNFKCECRPGYFNDGSSCQDYNECESVPSPCDENAICYNVDGSFECRCSAGYTGNGRTCVRAAQRCGEFSCHLNARCVFNNDAGYPICECNPGYTGDGSVCTRTVDRQCGDYFCDSDAHCTFNDRLRTPICECNPGFIGNGEICAAVEFGCNEVNNCDSNAECQLDEDEQRYVCVCNDGYSGDGVTCEEAGDHGLPTDICRRCDRNAECVYDQSQDRYGCRCVAGYRGDGYRCDAIDCRLLNDCDGNARCEPDRETNSYQCRCNPGYQGDGRTCVAGGCNVLNDCDRNARCIEDPRDPRLYTCVCNPGYDGDGKVCLQRLIPCNQVNNCDPNAECLYDPDSQGYRCVCRRGYLGDGLRCRRRDYDCRSEPGLCSPSATCVQNQDVFVCLCNQGYEGDGRSCRPLDQSDGDFLVYAQGMSIMRVPFDRQQGPGQQILYIPGQTAIAVDFDCYERFIYWTDVSEGTISRARTDGSDAEVLVSDGLSSPEGVAVDWLSRNLYWTDSGVDRIEVARLDGTYRRTLFDQGLVNPRSIVLNPSRGVFYWSDWNRADPKIERANMDGSEREIFVQSDISLPNALTLDTRAQQLCWGDAGTQRIECIRTDGVGRRVIYGLAQYPFSLTFSGNNYYWTDWEMTSIPNINRNGGQLNDALSLPIGGNGRLYGIVTAKEQCERVNNACGLNNGGCRFLCLPTPGGGRTCACPDDIDPRQCDEIGLLRKKK